MSTPALHIGVATEDITPPASIRMSGFAGREFGNMGVLDPLRASALWLSDGTTRGLIITLDTIGLDPADDRALRERIGADLGIAPDAVLIACSHTHSGPATMTIRATGDKETLWTAEVLERAHRAATKAANAPIPVLPHGGSTRCDAAINRRHPNGPRDPDCRLLTFTDTDGAPAAALLHYTMHPVALGNSNRLLSADWVGAARQGIEATLGCPVLYLQGCCGDINPHFSGQRGIQEMQQAAEKVVAATRTAIGASQPLEHNGLHTGKADTSLPLCPLDTAEETRLETIAREVLAKGEESSLGARQLAEADIQWVQACEKIRESHVNGLPHVPVRVSALSIGEITLVGLPGEIFSEIGLRIRGDDPNIWPVGFANGNLGYLYPDSALDEGGYEVNLAYRLYGEQRVGPGTADALVAAARLAYRSARTSL